MTLRQSSPRFSSWSTAFRASFLSREEAARKIAARNSRIHLYGGLQLAKERLHLRPDVVIEGAEVRALCRLYVTHEGFRGIFAKRARPAGTPWLLAPSCLNDQTFALPFAHALFVIDGREVFFKWLAYDSRHMFTPLSGKKGGVIPIFATPMRAIARLSPKMPSPILAFLTISPMRPSLQFRTGPFGLASDFSVHVSYCCVDCGWAFRL